MEDDFDFGFTAVDESELEIDQFEDHLRKIYNS